MIKFTYSESDNFYKLELAELTVFSKNELPLSVEFRRVADNFLNWKHDLVPNQWVNWNGGSHRYNVYVYTKSGRLIFEKLFNVAVDGNVLEKTFHFFINELRFRSKGLIIGPHDGTFGHWIYDVLQNKADVVFVEGTKSQLDKLRKNYSHLTNAKFLNEIVTPDGSIIEWYEGDQGFTNTVKKEVIQKFLKDEEITTETRQSISINDLIKREMDTARMGPAFDWVHIDVEGLDCELILALEYEPSLIIFETAHATRQNYFRVLDWLQEHNYKLYHDGLDAIAIKNNYFNPNEEDLRE